MVGPQLAYNDPIHSPPLTSRPLSPSHPFHSLLLPLYRFYCATLWQRGICCSHEYRYVCPSVTSRYCTKTTKRGITQTTPYDSPGLLVFWRQRSWGEVQIICVWSTWCHWHRIISCSIKNQKCLPFWCWLTEVVREKRPLNWFSTTSHNT